MSHHQILFGVIPFIVLRMVIGGYAIWLFVRLRGVANPTLREDDGSTVALRGLRKAAGNPATAPIMPANSPLR